MFLLIIGIRGLQESKTMYRTHASDARDPWINRFHEWAHHGIRTPVVDLRPWDGWQGPRAGAIIREKSPSIHESYSSTARVQPNQRLYTVYCYAHSTQTSLGWKIVTIVCCCDGPACLNCPNRRSRHDNLAGLSIRQTPLFRIFIFSWISGGI